MDLATAELQYIQVVDKIVQKKTQLLFQKWKTQLLKCFQYWDDLTRPIAEFDSWRGKRIQITHGRKEKLISYISSASIQEESCK